MSRSHGVRALAALAFLAGAPAHGADPKPEPDVVALHFAWPAGIDAQVETSLRRLTDDGGKVGEVKLAGFYRMRTETDPRGLKIETDGLVYTHVNGRDIPGGVPGTAELAGYFQVLGLFPPTRIVSPDARIIALEDVRDAKAMIGRAGPDAPDPEARAVLEELAEARVSADRSRQEARDLWQLTIYQWDGARLEIGREYLVPNFGEMQVGPGVMAKLSVRLVAKERTPCRAEESEARCVRLAATMMVDPEAHRRGIEAGLRKMSLQLGGQIPSDAPVEGVLRSVSQTTEIELVVEPGRLLPHHMVVRKRERIESATGETNEKTTERVRRYHY